MFHWRKDLDVINETLNKLTQEFKILKNESEENRDLIESLIFQASDGAHSYVLTNSTTTLPLVPELYAFEFCGGVIPACGCRGSWDLLPLPHPEKTQLFGRAQEQNLKTHSFPGRA